MDREQIGVIGICGSGDFALSAAQVDIRIKAVAAASMYDMSAAARMGMDDAALRAAKERFARQRWIGAEKGEPEYIPGFPKPDAEWMRFYAVKRGHHPNAKGGFTMASNLTMAEFPATGPYRRNFPQARGRTTYRLAVLIKPLNFISEVLNP